MTPSLDPVAGIDLQEIRAGDIENLADPCRDLFEHETWHAAAVERSLAAPGSFALLARTAGCAAGLILARAAADECEILWLFVPAFRRRGGVGRRLLRAALETAADRGARTAYLEASEANRAAIALYEAEGFRPTSRRRAYYGREREAKVCDALVFKKALTGGETRPGH